MKLHVTLLLSATLSLAFGQTGDLNNNRAHADVALDAAKANEVALAWHLERRGPVTHRPLEFKDYVISADWTGHVFCINPKDGTYVWDKPIAEKVMTEMPWHGFVGTGAISGDVLVEASAEGFAYGIDPMSGETKWKTGLSDQEHAGNIAHLLAHEGVVFIGLSSPEEALDGKMKDFKPSFQGEVLAVRASDGEILWRTSLVDKPHTGVAMWSSFAIDGETGILYFTTSNNYVGKASDTSDAFFALDAKTGEKKWHRQMTEHDVWTMAEPVGPDYAFGAGPQLFEAGGRKLVGGGQKSGIYHVLDRQNGEKVWSNTVGYPAVGGGIRGEAAIAADRILVWSNNSFDEGKPPENFPITIKALDPETGATLWNREKAQPAIGKSSGLLVGEVYFVGSLDGVMRGYAAEDGRDLWKSEAYGSVASSPSLVNNHLLVWGTGVPKMFSGGAGTNGIVAVKLPVK